MGREVDRSGVAALDDAVLRGKKEFVERAAADEVEEIEGELEEGEEGVEPEEGEEAGDAEPSEEG